jgi:hypothetical protein
MIRYWIAESHDLPAEVADRLLRELQSRSAEVGEAISMIERQLAR